MVIRVRVLAVLVGALFIAACGGGATTPTVGPATVAPPTATATAATTAPPASPKPHATPVTTPRPDLLVVALGDSIPYNLEDDCPGCTGFVDQYGVALAAATGKTVAVENRSQHTGLTVDQLVRSLNSSLVRGAVADADAIIVGIAHNDVPMNRDDDACDGAGGDSPDWTKFTDACLQTEINRFRPSYEAVYAEIATLRAGKPTILRTINRYNDWIGWPGHELSPAGIKATSRVIAAWNKMICAAAEAKGFLCADISTRFNGKDGTSPSGDLLGSDYTHPSQQGNDAIAEVLIGLGFAPIAP